MKPKDFIRAAPLSCHNRRMTPRGFIDFLEQLDRHSPTGLTAAQPVRDLAWLLFAPDSLEWNHPSIQPYVCPPYWLERFAERWQQRLLAISREPSHLITSLTPPPRRLGLYAEMLLAWWLEQEAELEIVLRHRPLTQERRTLGDFDFIVSDKVEGKIHIELAVKFFLGIADAARFDQWVGSSLQDSLGIKWRKATQQQLRLGFHPAARALLGAPPDRCWFWFKAWLFHPLARPAQTQSPITAEHSRGVWGTQASLRRHWGNEAPCWPLRLLQRLAPARFDDAFAAETLDAVLQRWQNESDGYPILIARLERHARGGWVEAERAYVVADDWPMRATEWLLSP